MAEKKYAATTTTPVGNTRNEIESLLTKHGADDIAFGTIQGHVVVGFTHSSRQVRYVVALPDPGAPEFARTPTGLRRSANEAAKAHQQAVRSIWRSMALVIKAKFVAIDSGVSSFEAEWGWSIVLPNGRTVGSMVAPAIEESYSSGHVPPLLGIEPQR